MVQQTVNRVYLVIVTTLAVVAICEKWQRWQLCGVAAVTIVRCGSGGNCEMWKRWQLLRYSGSGNCVVWQRWQLCGVAAVAIAWSGSGGNCAVWHVKCGVSASEVPLEAVI